MNSIILLVVNDTSCRLEIEAIASEMSVECVPVSYGDHLSDLVDRTNPFLLIVEFSTEVANWVIKHLTEIKSEHPNFPVIGIIPGGSEADYIRLERAGCDQVLSKEIFLKKIKSLIEHYFR